MTRICFAMFAIALILVVFHKPSKAEGLDGKTEINIWGLSFHSHKQDHNELNEKNPGIGIRRYFAGPSTCNTFLEGDYIARNTMRGKVLGVGWGMQCPLFKMGDTEIFAGGIAGYGQYENPIRHKTYRGPIGYPLVGVRTNGVSLNLGVIPPLKGTGKQAIYMLSLGVEVQF